MARMSTRSPSPRRAEKRRPAGRSRPVSYGPPLPLVSRRVWVLGCDTEKVTAAVTFLSKAGHDVRGAEPGGELAPALRDHRPDMVVIDMSSDADRGRHLATQLRADRGTRQLPIVLVGVASQDGPKMDRAVPGPTRRYAGSLDSASVLDAILKEL
jgi:CheY-like chemotaxis protein